MKISKAQVKNIRIEATSTHNVDYELQITSGTTYSSIPAEGHFTADLNVLFTSANAAAVLPLWQCCNIAKGEELLRHLQM